MRNGYIAISGGDEIIRNFLSIGKCKQNHQGSGIGRPVRIRQAEMQLPGRAPDHLIYIRTRRPEGHGMSLAEHTRYQDEHASRWRAGGEKNENGSFSTTR